MESRLPVLPLSRCLYSALHQDAGRSPPPAHIPRGEGGGSQTQVPWWVGGWVFRLFRPRVLSLKSEVFCWEMSMSALATVTPGRRDGHTDTWFRFWHP